MRASVAVEAAVPAGVTALRFWLYPDRLAVVPAAADERSLRWVFPSEVDLGGIDVRAVSVDGVPRVPHLVRRPTGTPRGRDAAGADLEVPIGPSPRAIRRVELDVVVRVPARFGRLGRARGQLSLAAPWYPLLLCGDAYDVAVDHDVRVRVAGDAAVLLGDAVGARDVRRTVRGAYAPAVVAARLHERIVSIGGGHRLRWLSPSPPYRAPDPSATDLDGLQDLVFVDSPALAAEAAADALSTLATGQRLAPSTTLTFVEVPTRTELVATAPGLLLASDRLYEIAPLAASREFHHRAVRRAVFRHLMRAGTERADPPADRPWADDVRAVAWLDRDEARRHGRARSPEELLGPMAFHPLVDQLLTAPQIAFADVFFSAVDEPDFLRDDPARARVPLARGRRMLEVMRDVLGPERHAALVDRILAGEDSVREALLAVDPDAAERLDLWVRSPLLPVNYRLAAVDSARTVEGRWRHEVRVERRGAYRGEPVEVLLVDEAGVEHVRTWDSAEPSGTLVFLTDAPRELVRLDPRGRLTQSGALADGHARADDATSHPWRMPLVRAFGLGASVAEGEWFGFVDVALRRAHDLDHSFRTGLRHDADASAAALAYVHGFGPRRDDSARFGAASVGVEGARLTPGFGGARDGGVRLALIGGATVETRRFLRDPRRGGALSVLGRAGPTWRDDGGVAWGGALSGRGTWTVPIGLRGAVAGFVGGGWSFGETLPAERQVLGGPLTLRAFEADELVGDAAAYAILEARFTPLTDLAWNAVHVAWVREVQLAAFAGAGAVVAPTRDELAGAAEVGLGVRFHFRYGGVQPGVLAVDAALPLTHRDAPAHGTRAPVGLRFAFDQFL